VAPGARFETSPVNAVNLPTTQLLSFRFGPDATLEGGLLAAVERIEAGGSF
jgi:hypothetical protein